MTVKERLHAVVDAMTDDEAAAALHAIETRRNDPVGAFFDAAPLDDEPVTEDDERALAEAQADVDAGRVVSLDELRDDAA